MRRAFFIIALILLALHLPSAQPGWTQELYLLGGGIKDTGRNDYSYSWMLHYMQGLGEHAAYSISYVNEGHLPNNHRDGISAQLWGRTSVLDRKLSLEAGVGPYRYFDTQQAARGLSYSDTHGWGALFSLAGVWRPESRWLARLQANWVQTDHGINTYSLLFGVGYQLEPPSRGPAKEGRLQSERATRNEITAFLGQTTVNSLDSPRSTARSLEYRRNLAPYLDWTAAWLNEGDNRLIRRNGLVSQLWAVRSFLEDRLNLGIGLGPYLAIDRYRDPQDGEGGEHALAAVVSLSASWRFSRSWAARLTWHRISTNYDRDTDVFLLGPSFLF